jgi:hypothetical protein
MKYNDGKRYTGAFAITPASDTEVAAHIGLLFDAAGTCTVRFESGGAQVVLPVQAGGFPIKVYSVDAISGATTVHGLV